SACAVELVLASGALQRLCPGEICLQSALHSPEPDLVPPGHGCAVLHRLGPAISVPSLPSPAPDASRDRVLGPNASARMAAHRVHLLLRSWHSDRRRGSDLGPAKPRVEAELG